MLSAMACGSLVLRTLLKSRSVSLFSSTVNFNLHASNIQHFEKIETVKSFLFRYDSSERNPVRSLLGR